MLLRRLKLLGQALLGLFLFLSCPILNAAGIPPHIQKSFAIGLLDNVAVSEDHVRLCAAVVLSKRLQKPAEETQALVTKMPLRQVKELAVLSFPIDYVEIPQAQLQTQGTLNHGASEFMGLKDTESPLFFLKNGKTFVRIFIHPMRDASRVLRAFGDPPIQRGRFLSQLTESRSVVLHDQQTEGTWSLKLSLPNAIGPFTQKHFTAEFAAIHFGRSERLLSAYHNKKLSGVFHLPEEEFVGFKGQGIDEGMLLRSLLTIPEEALLVPAAAVLTKGLGAYLPHTLATSEMLKYLMAEKPGEIFAEILKELHLLNNSHHGQNNVFLIFQDGRRPEARFRDMDLDLWTGAPSVSQEGRPDSKRRSAHNEGGNFVDFSLMNGIPEGAALAVKPEEYVDLIYSFYRSFFETLSAKANMSIDLGRVEGLVRRLDNLSDVEGTLLSQDIQSRGAHAVQVRRKFRVNLDKLIGPPPGDIVSPGQDQSAAIYRTIQQRSREELLKRLPEMASHQDSPREALRAHFLSPEIKRRPSLTVQTLVALGLEEVRGGHLLGQIRSEFLNPKTRNNSLVMNILREASVDAMGPFFYFLQEMDQNLHLRFFKNFIEEYVRLRGHENNSVTMLHRIIGGDPKLAHNLSREGTIEELFETWMKIAPLRHQEQILSDPMYQKYHQNSGCLRVFKAYAKGGLAPLSGVSNLETLIKIRPTLRYLSEAYQEFAVDREARFKEKQSQSLSCGRLLN
ncbi:MAG: hypothetical protein JNM39_09490 [Bdellovibrionaceae bacterium]|nr:hypothetical protein [Pseudobdellovibrionaceae bacterium]